MKTKIKFLRNQLEKYKIIILLIPILAILSLTYATSKSFLAEGQEDNIDNVEFSIDNDFYDYSCGDIDGDMMDEILLAKKDDILVYNQSGEISSEYKNIFKKEKDKFQIALGDVDGDGQDEIVKYYEENKSLVEVYKDSKLILKFYAFPGINIGTSLTLGDINNNGSEEIIVGAGKGGGPQIKIFEDSGEEIASFFVFNPSLRGGVNVASGNVDGDEEEEVITSEKREGEGVVRIYKMDDLKTFINTFMAYPNTFKDGSKILASDLNGDNKSEIVTYKDVREGDKDLKMFQAGGEQKHINKEVFEDLSGENDLKACDFNGKKALVFGVSDEESAMMKIIYDY